MYALIAASYYPEITLTIAMTPADFVMEGFYQGKRDGQTEWPGEGESSASWQGKPGRRICRMHTAIRNTAGR